MESKFFTAIVSAICIIFFSSCASTTEPEEEIFIHPNEVEFMSALKETGLNWEISELHRRVFRFENHNQLLILTCPTRPVTMIVNIRICDYGGGNSPWGERYVRFSFSTFREPTEDEANRFKEEGLLTNDEWLLFLELAGRILGEEDYISKIAERLPMYLADFQFDTYNGNRVTVAEGTQGNINYRIRFEWSYISSLYTYHGIDLMVA